jgi:lysophospholipase L1-like esterase
MRFAAVPRSPGRIVFLGDSITEFTQWEDWFPQLRTSNRGVGGQAIRDVMARLETAIVDPKAVSLLIGTNDLHGLGASRELGEIAAQMRALVTRIRELAPSACLLVNGVMPRSVVFRDRIIELNHAYQTIANDSGSTFIDTWAALAAPDGAIRGELSSDGLHLSIAGYRVWVDVLRPHLERFAD